MGLGVISYRRVELVRECAARDSGCHSGHQEEQLWLGPLSFDRWSPMSPGDYRCHEPMTGLRFSYSSYSRWRDRLSRSVLGKSAQEVWDDPRPGPLLELIHFSDCEGAFNSTICRKLASDLRSIDGSGAEMYDWRSVADRFATFFEHASDGGAVVFV